MKKSVSKDGKILELLTRGVEDVIDRKHLEAALRGGKKLRVKLGIDPTAPDLHVGHAVVLGKLRQFQDLGHKAVLIIGDFTATIGDPSGRNEARKSMTRLEAKRNEKQYLAQAGKIIDLRKTEIRHNGEWHAKNGLAALLELTAVATVQQVLKRQDFAKRIAEDRDITLLETLYPLLQGYDSVAVKSDVELGGTDQLLNVLMGRKVQRHYRVPEQDVLTVSLLEGLDGTKKMSKSIGNTVNIFDSPEEMFGKVMTLPDALVVRWFTLATDMSMEEVAGYERDLKKGTNPKLIKSKLALEIAKRYHGSKAALAAQENFENLFAKKDLAVADMPELKISGKMTALDLVMKSGVAASRGDARRLIEQGAVSVDGEARKDAQEKPALKTGTVVKIGKKNFFRIKA